MNLFKISPIGLLFLILCFSCEEKLNGPKLIEKSISYHDPNGEWSNLAKTFYIRDIRPGGDERQYTVSMDIPNDYLKYVNAPQMLVYEVSKDSCLTVSGEGATCERAMMLRDYYFYLWGLPMKLLDGGTQIEKEVQREVIKGIEAWVVRVPYEKDIWYFYLHPEDFRMIAYKFQKDEKKQIGEIIYLENELIVGSMKIPSERSWYRTENDEFLGTDFLLKTED